MNTRSRITVASIVSVIVVVAGMVTTPVAQAASLTPQEGPSENVGAGKVAVITNAPAEKAVLPPGVEFLYAAGGVASPEGQDQATYLVSIFTGGKNGQLAAATTASVINIVADLGDPHSLTEALNTALNAGARVIVIPDDVKSSVDLNKMLGAAAAQGVVVVVAAGDAQPPVDGAAARPQRKAHGSGTLCDVFYRDIPAVICVGATDNDGTRLVSANIGLDTVRERGVGIPGLNAHGELTRRDGTEPAAALVAAGIVNALGGTTNIPYDTIFVMVLQAQKSNDVSGIGTLDPNKLKKMLNSNISRASSVLKGLARVLDALTGTEEAWAAAAAISNPDNGVTCITNLVPVAGVNIDGTAISGPAAGGTTTLELRRYYTATDSATPTTPTTIYCLAVPTTSGYGTSYTSASGGTCPAGPGVFKPAATSPLFNLSQAFMTGLEEGLYSVYLKTTTADGDVKQSEPRLFIESPGKVKWTFTSSEPIEGTPTIADVNQDGVMDLVVGTVATQGQVKVLDAKTGATIYASNKSPQVDGAIYASVRAADLVLGDGGKPELIAAVDKNGGGSVVVLDPDVSGDPIGSAQITKAFSPAAVLNNFQYQTPTTGTFVDTFAIMNGQAQLYWFKWDQLSGLQLLTSAAYPSPLSLAPGATQERAQLVTGRVRPGLYPAGISTGSPASTAERIISVSLGQTNAFRIDTTMAEQAGSPTNQGPYGPFLGPYHPLGGDFGSSTQPDGQPWPGSTSLTPSVCWLSFGTTIAVTTQVVKDLSPGCVANPGPTTCDDKMRIGAIPLVNMTWAVDPLKPWALTPKGNQLTYPPTTQPGLDAYFGGEQKGAMTALGINGNLAYFVVDALTGAIHKLYYNDILEEVKAEWVATPEASWQGKGTSTPTVASIAGKWVVFITSTEGLVLAFDAMTGQQRYDLLRSSVPLGLITSNCINPEVGQTASWVFNDITPSQVASCASPRIVINPGPTGSPAATMITVAGQSGPTSVMIARDLGAGSGLTKQLQPPAAWWRRMLASLGSWLSVTDTATASAPSNYVLSEDSMYINKVPTSNVSNKTYGGVAERVFLRFLDKNGHPLVNRCARLYRPLKNSAGASIEFLPGNVPEFAEECKTAANGNIKCARVKVCEEPTITDGITREACELTSADPALTYTVKVSTTTDPLCGMGGVQAASVGTSGDLEGTYDASLYGYEYLGPTMAPVVQVEPPAGGSGGVTTSRAVSTVAPVMSKGNGEK